MSVTESSSQDSAGAVLLLAVGSAPDTVYTVVKISPGSTEVITPLKGHPDAEVCPCDGTRADALAKATAVFDSFGDS